MMQKFPYKAARKMTLEDSIVETMSHSNSIAVFFEGEKQC